MNQQVKNLIFIFSLVISIHSVSTSLPTDYLHRLYTDNFLNYEKGLVYKSLKQLQDSVSQVNSNLFPSPMNTLFHSPINTKLYFNLYDSLQNANIVFGKRLGNPKKPNARLRIIQQLNKEIVKNQLVAYEQFFKKLRRYDPDPMESRQAVNLIKTLFRFPVLLLFSNIFQLPLLPTLILASPFLNSPEPGNAVTNSLANSISKTPLSTVMTNAVSNTITNAMSGAASSTGQSLPAAASQQISSHLPFSLNPLVPINQMLNNFISELIGDLQNSPLINNLMQSFNQMLIKPNRVSSQNPLQSQPTNQTPQNQASNSLPLDQSLNLSKPIAVNANDTDLLTANASTTSFAYQEPPNSLESLPNVPLLGPVASENSITPGGSILNTLASSLLESNKNYQLTETLGVNNAGSIQELALNAVNTLATMLRIKKQKKSLNSNEAMLLDLLTDKNYLDQVTSISNLLKFGLKQKVEKEMNICLVRTICESNQKQISFAFDQLFSLAMHMTGMESRIEQSPWHMYYKVGRKMINEKNICRMIPKCRGYEESEGKSFAKKKLNFVKRIQRVKKIEDMLSGRRMSSTPDYQKPFRIMKKVRKFRFAKRLFNRSLRKADKLTRRMTRLFF